MNKSDHSTGFGCAAINIELDKWKALAGELLKATKIAIANKVLGHPTVEASAMEDLEIVIRKAEGMGL